ncbi:embryonic protein UVS.2-like [Mixophyes fleayi]|uniref:embryonic protein UVS.2-like n=1 Tax=Mixophyes fleayi TaxID=3061075 RepID=UPI003F4D8BD8
MNGFEPDTEILNMVKAMEESHPAGDAREPEDTFSRIIEVNKGYNITVQEGDLIIKTGRSATTCENCLWPKSADGTVPVPYTLSTAYNLTLIRTSMQEYETLTCVRFIPRTTEKDFLNIVSAHGCMSYVGRTGGAQTVGIDIGGCMIRGAIQHELQHSLGFHHEHARSDRDDYVNIMYEYISPDVKSNFAKHTTNNLGLEYDYGSMMHYSRYAFTNTRNQATIVPKPDPNVPIGQRDGMSILDVSKVNRLYQCNVCGHLLNDRKGTVNSANYPFAYPNDASCVWLIRTPSDQVTLNFNAFDVQSSPNCVSDYIKIYDGPSRKSPVLLDKRCGSGKISPIVASTNQMLIEFVSDGSGTGTGFKATYSSV